MNSPFLPHRLKNALPTPKSLRSFGLAAFAVMVCLGPFSRLMNAAVDSTPSESEQPQKVLVLGTYDPENAQSQAKVTNFAAALARQLDGVKVRAELVDVDPNFQGADRFRRTADSLFARYSGQEKPWFDAIVALDRESLDFMLKSGQQLFGEVPTVFSSVGLPDPRVLQHRDLYTGETQTPDVKGNIDLAFSQFPEVRKMAVVLDDTPKGKFIDKQIDELKRDYTNRRFVRLKSKDYSSEQLLETLKGMPKDTVVLWGSWEHDKNGPVTLWRNVLQKASQVCPSPIFGIDSSTLGNGIVGGKLLVPENESRQISKILKEVLEGTSPQEIPIQNHSAVSYMFDYPQLAKWGVSLGQIPPKSYVINRPGIGFFARQSTLWGISGGIFVVAVLVALMISVRYRRRAESQWRKTEQRFSFIYEESPLAYQSLDTKGRILSVNRAWCELFGYSPNEGVGRKFADFLAPDSKRLFLEYWEQCTQPDLCETRIDLPSIEIKLVTNHGHIVPVLFYLRKAYDPVEKTTAFYSAMHDISQRRDAEDTLRQEDIRLNSLLTLNQMLDSSVSQITDYAIRASLELTESERGYLAFVNENEETLTLHAWAFEHNGEYFVLNEPTTLPVETTGLWDGMLEERRPILVNDTHAPNPSWHKFGDNSYLPGRRLSVPIFDKDRIVAVASVANKQREYAEHDIQQLTLLLEGMWRIIERKKTTDKLHEYTNNLENANRQLEECSLAAQQASRAKSEFLANMSHEIRTPMTAIIGFTELLRTEGDISKAPPARIEAIDTVNRNANYLLFLLNDILDLSKIEAGHLEIDPDDCDLPRLISDVTKLMETRAVAKELQLDVEAARDVPSEIHTDSYRLRQILLNLLGNAVKFTHQGMVRLVVSHKKVANENRVIFEVIDTGIGISQEKINQIFDPFTQADSSTSRKFGGTGLGLCISRKLARMLGGELYVESELGIGSIFTLSLPCTVPAKDSESDQKTCCGADSGSSHSKKSRCKSNIQDLPQLDCHVLVVDDGADNRRLISAFLNKSGAKVTLCENGLMAYELLMAEREKESKAADDPIDLVLMDMQMPVMDGYQATRKLRQSDYLKPVIAITANAMKKDRDKCLEAGCDDYLTKPINRTALVETVAAYVNQTKPTKVIGDKAIVKESAQAEFLTTGGTKA